MILKVSWDVFHMKFYNRANVYVIQTDESWIFYTSDGNFIIQCEVMKKANGAENIMFIERYCTGRTNIIAAELEEPEEIIPEDIEEELIEETLEDEL